jgi:hypothetical protein
MVHDQEEHQKYGKNMKVHVNYGDDNNMTDSSGRRLWGGFNKRSLLVQTKTAYKSIAYDLVQFLIRYRYENGVR